MIGDSLSIYMFLLSCTKGAGRSDAGITCTMLVEQVPFGQARTLFAQFHLCIHLYMHMYLGFGRANDLLSNDQLLNQ